MEKFPVRRIILAVVDHLGNTQDRKAHTDLSARCDSEGGLTPPDRQRSGLLFIIDREYFLKFRDVSPPTSTADLHYT